MNKSNDEKIAEYQKAKKKKWIIIGANIVVIILEVLALFGIIDMLWGCFLFAIVYLFKKIF